MSLIVLGTIGFVTIHLFDVAALKGMRWIKPFIWTAGCLLLMFAAVMVCTDPAKISLPVWLSISGWIMLPGAIGLLMYSLFGNLPFRKTYLEKGVPNKLIKNGLYSIVRHPGIYGFGLLMLSLFLLSGSKLMLLAGLIWLAIDIILVVLQDLIFFGRMFPEYAIYRQETPMLIPTWRSLATYSTDFVLNSLDFRVTGRKVL
jgi:protein-S-isoprenylcysteine O-methyltransferase Ste14